MVDAPEGYGPEKTTSGRRLNPRATRLLALVVVAGLVVALVIQNSQQVTIRFLFITGHLALIWVLVACLVIGAAFGFVSGRRVRRRRRRSAASD
ncbi:MAG TPA: LapA family protein [Acidimicrobiales bacterium]